MCAQCTPSVRFFKHSGPAPGAVAGNLCGLCLGLTTMFERCIGLISRRGDRLTSDPRGPKVQNGRSRKVAAQAVGGGASTPYR